MYQDNLVLSIYTVLGRLRTVFFMREVQIMAFQMIHMEIAYRVIRELGLTDGKEEFLLGSVSPDSVHMRSDYSVENKIHSHLFEGCGPWGDTQDYERWMENIYRFLRDFTTEEKSIKRKMLVMGIFTHCITDYFNDITIWRGAQKRTLLPMSQFKNEFYVEARAIDEWLYQNSENTTEIRSLLMNSQNEGFYDFYTAKDVAMMKNNLLNIQYDVPPADVRGFRYYTKEMLIKFLDEVSEYVVQNLEGRF